MQFQYLEKIDKIAQDLQEKAKQHGHKDKFIDGNELRANKIGKLGELGFRDFLDLYSIKYEYDESLDDLDEKDFFLWEAEKKAKLDLKTQRIRENQRPIPIWNCEVNDKQKDKKMDYYAFTKYNEDIQELHFVGFIGYERFWKIAQKRKVGETFFGGEPVKGDNWCVQISDLETPEEFLKQFKKKQQ